MATAEHCERALLQLAEQLAANPSAQQRAGYERTLSCTIRDLQIVFGGRLDHGQLRDIHRTSDPAAQIRIDVGSDDLLKLVDGSLPFGSAFASGRIRISAGVRDLLRLRSALS